MRETTQERWEIDVLKAKGLVLVDFWAAWCGPCKMMEPILEELAAKYQDRLSVIKVDVQAYPNLAMEYNVMNLPTMLLFEGGEVKETLSGHMPLTVLERRLAAYLSGA